MGTEVPPTWPEIDPILWYLATVDRYTFLPGPEGCTTFIGTESACRLGQDIIDYIDDDRQCTGNPLGGPPVVTADRLTDLLGEWDTKVACEIANGL